MNIKVLRPILFIYFVGLILSGCNKDEEFSDTILPPEGSSTKQLAYEVIEYLPGPGQFINEEVSGMADIKNQEEANKFAVSRLSQNLYVSLGAWGGHLVVKLDGSLNNSGNYDFAIGGNSFDSSNEPGIVWVMQDSNGNGKPDDTWYELRGSYFGQPGYERNYWVTYFRPDSKGNTLWVDSNGEEGIVPWMESFHSQDFYYPGWIKEDSFTLEGSRLPQRAWQDPETGIWNNLPYEWGYADNNGEDMLMTQIESKNLALNYFRISDAVDESNDPVSLSHINFIKVQTAVNGHIPLLGENSTEILGFFPAIIP